MNVEDTQLLQVPETDSQRQKSPILNAQRILRCAAHLSKDILAGFSPTVFPMLETTGKHLGLDLISICVVVPGAYLCRSWKSADMWAAYETFPVESKESDMEDLVEWIRGDKCHAGLVKDAPASLSYLDEYPSLLSCTSCVIVPIQFSGTPWGVVCFAKMGDMELSEDDMMVYETIAMLIAALAHTDMDDQLIRKHIVERFAPIRERLDKHD